MSLRFHHRSPAPLRVRLVQPLPAPRLPQCTAAGGRLPWWRMGGDDDTFSPAPLQELEAELGGLFVGGKSKFDSNSNLKSFFVIVSVCGGGVNI
ncbi:hypothetical protein F7725_008844 [Dissostichus mawsoni]|uniref:Uncharacterized protein n=1 Tax=Dissostichus mawsoni TaxID=36200 RepID=A0A7J5Z5D7_DISMA|nr:hypothetical protein F7725_008844 [Dissostichus mawsoni]